MKLLVNEDIDEGSVYPNALISFGNILFEYGGKAHGDYFVIQIPTWIKKHYYDWRRERRLYGRLWLIFRSNSYDMIALNDTADYEKDPLYTGNFIVNRTSLNFFYRDIL